MQRTQWSMQEPIPTEGREPLLRKGYCDGKVGGKRYVEDVGEQKT
jgi:hypothetical protein